MEKAQASTVAFLFTDIEGSTHLWELFPEAMRAALARHDAILRRAVESNQGQIVKTTGDGVHAAFETASGAISAALAAQLALIGDPWVELQPQALRVRMGVHTGEAEVRTGDYYGNAVNRAARLMSVGHGEQVLVSNSTADMVRDSMPPGTSLLDLGEHRLKDLIRPEHVFQLVHPALPSGFPPLRSLDAYPNNLPVQLTSFIGRERELSEAKMLLSTARLLTLTGSGGTGKTRLALQVAAELLPDFSDGVWQVELASLTEAEMVPPAVASAMDLGDVAGLPILEQITNYLQSKRLLLLLDNCEHLIDACARLADHLLRHCPSLKILASSREGLGIAGEITYPVPSLSLPPVGDSTPETLSSSEAAQLFIERATAVNPHFVLTPANTAAITQVCRRLDGIPLALELAAARVKIFTVEQIADHLDDRFRLLTGGSRTALPRQQTLRALIDWSYDLLSEPERLLLRRLAVFVGGWSFEAAEAVCSDLDVLSLLEGLVNKSLVGVDVIQDQARYTMLETIRQYARDRLVESGEVAALRNRHFDYFFQLSERAQPELSTNRVYAWFDRLAADYDNLRAAIEWGQAEQPEQALLMIGDLAFFWLYRADDRQQALDWLNDLLPQMESRLAGSTFTQAQYRACSRGRIAAGMLLMGLGDTPAASELFQTAIALERELSPGFWLVFALGMSAVLAMMIGDFDRTKEAAEEALALRVDYDSRWRLIPLSILMGAEHSLGNQVRAERIRREIRGYLEEVDHPMFIPTFLGLGLEARLERHYEDAEMYFSEGLKFARQLRSRLFIATMESELAHLARETGDLETAGQAYRKLIWQWRDLGHLPAVAHQLECMAFLAYHDGDLERAARLLGAADALRDSPHAPRREVEQLEFDATVASLRDRMSPAAFETAWSAGRQMDLERAIYYATASSGPAEILADK